MEPSGLESIATWPGDESAAGWRHRDGREAHAGPVDEVRELASVTKLLTATAVLVAVEEGVVGLDDPAGPPGASVRLLLCHASGLPFDGSTPIAEPGQRRIYGNAAYEVLGDVVAGQAGIPFADYLHEAVCQPLGMVATTLAGSPAHGARSTVRDLLRLVDELLDPGTVLAPVTLEEATTVQLPDLAGVLPGFGRHDPNPWGLGFEIHGHKTPHWMPAECAPDAFGHFGQQGGFLWVDPQAGVGCVALAGAPFGPWAAEAWPALGASVLARSAS